MLHRSIRLRIIVVVLGVALLVLLSVGAAFYTRDNRTNRDAAASALGIAAQHAAARTASTLRTYAGLASYLTTLSSTHLAVTLTPYSLTANPLDDQAQALIASYPRITGIYLVTPTGAFLHGTARLDATTTGPVTTLPSTAGSPAPLATLIGQAAANSAPLHTITSSADSPSPVGDLWIAARIHHTGITTGIILLRIDAVVLLPTPADPLHGISTQLIAAGQVYDGQSQAVPSQRVVNPALTTILTHQDPIDYTDGPTRYAAIGAPIPNAPDWQIIARQPAAELDTTGSTLIPLLLAGLLLVLVLIVSIWAALTFLIIRPIDRIGNAVRSIAEGRLDSPLPCRHDELGALASSISTMRQTLVLDAQAAQDRAASLSMHVLHFTQALEPIAEGQLHRRIPLIDDPDSPLLDAVEATNNLIRRFRRLVAGLKDSVREVIDSSAGLQARILEAAHGAGHQQEILEQQRQLVAAMSAHADAAGQAARDTAAAGERVSDNVDEGSLALADVTASGDAIRQRTLESTNRIKKLQDTAVNLTGLVGQVQDMAASLGLLAYNGMLSATRAGQSDPAFARMAEETQSLAHSFDSSLLEIRAAVETAQRDIGAVILSSEAIAQDVIASLQARDELARVFLQLTETVAQLASTAASARAKATEQARLAASVRDGNDLVAQAYERIRMNLEASAEEVTQRAADMDRLGGSMADLQVDGPATLSAKTGSLLAPPRGAPTTAA